MGGVVHVHREGLCRARAVLGNSVIGPTGFRGASRWAEGTLFGYGRPHGTSKDVIDNSLEFLVREIGAQNQKAYRCQRSRGPIRQWSAGNVTEMAIGFKSITGEAEVM
jgi:hypothetical protein